ncbi:hypothetical protein WH50_10415 [Pokkaliibacter plantistimulans]|uniref:Lipoprotein n=1 Tax=Pokkaliibacter plantistimulans TaxID=1635171 RepID=A0ABX5M1G6_9GAMM|nr:hypothetical protein [Pokkaliibacter plantistimulans]PXF31333.1 hypothetical protein WH50_10415 [Pokkaliibacter plantistimulans]
MKRILGMALSLLLTGCATVMDGKINTYVNPYKPVNTNGTVLALDADLEGKGYLQSLSLTLLGRGFSAVYPVEELPAKAKPDYYVRLGLGKRSEPYTVREPQYGYVNTGTWERTCTTVDNKERCVSRPRMAWDVVGYSNELRNATLYTVTLAWHEPDNRTGEPILKVVTSSRKEGCSDDKVYRFLITQAALRFTQMQSSENDFSVEMPEGYQCN